MASGRDFHRLRVVFSGRVQGVGFRYETVRLAAKFNVAGSVRNTNDEKVELIAEGKETELLDFLHAIQASRLGRNITGQMLHWEPPTGAFKTFGVSFS